MVKLTLTWFSFPVMLGLMQGGQFTSQQLLEFTQLTQLHNYETEVQSCGNTDWITGLIFVCRQNYFWQVCAADIPSIFQAATAEQHWLVCILSPRFHSSHSKGILRRKSLCTLVCGQHALLISTHVNVIYGKSQSKMLHMKPPHNRRTEGQYLRGRSLYFQNAC
jgi:hypothetical protein